MGRIIPTLVSTALAMGLSVAVGSAQAQELERRSEIQQSGGEELTFHDVRQVIGRSEYSCELTVIDKWGTSYPVSIPLEDTMFRPDGPRITFDYGCDDGGTMSVTGTLNLSGGRGRDGELDYHEYGSYTVVYVEDGEPGGVGGAAIFIAPRINMSGARIRVDGGAGGAGAHAPVAAITSGGGGQITAHEGGSGGDGGAAGYVGVATSQLIAYPAYVTAWGGDGGEGGSGGLSHLEDPNDCGVITGHGGKGGRGGNGGGAGGVSIQPINQPDRRILLPRGRLSFEALGGRGGEGGRGGDTRAYGWGYAPGEPGDGGDAGDFGSSAQCSIEWLGAGAAGTPFTLPSTRTETMRVSVGGIGGDAAPCGGIPSDDPDHPDDHGTTGRSTDSSWPGLQSGWAQISGAPKFGWESCEPEYEPETLR